MMDVEKGFPIKDEVEENIMEVAGNSATISGPDIPPALPGEDGQYHMMSTPDRRRVSEELREEKKWLELERANQRLNKRGKNANMSLHGVHEPSAGLDRARADGVSLNHSSADVDPSALLNGTIASSGLVEHNAPRESNTLISSAALIGGVHSPTFDGSSASDASGVYHTMEDSITAIQAMHHKRAFEDLSFGYRRNILDWRATLFKHSLKEFDMDSIKLAESSKTIANDLDQYSRVMDTYRSFRANPGDLHDSEDVRQMGRKMLNIENNEAEMKLYYPYYMMNVMRYGKTGIGYEEDENAAAADQAAKQLASKKFSSRLVMVLFGGFALIVLMLIMTLHPTRLTSLLITSLFVFAVAIALAWYMDEAESKDVIGATAAYAAVLVDFVGTSTTASH